MIWHGCDGAAAHRSGGWIEYASDDDMATDHRAVCVCYYEYSYSATSTRERRVLVVSTTLGCLSMIR